MNDIDRNPWRRLVTSVCVSSLAATFLNVGASTLDHPRALAEPSALFLPAAAGAALFLVAQLPLLLVARIVDRRWQWHAPAWGAAVGTLVCVAGVLAPIVTALARDADGERGLALWGMLAATAAASGLASFVLSTRAHSIGAGAAAAAMPLVALEACFGLWYTEFRMPGSGSLERAGALLGVFAACVATLLLLRKLLRPGSSAIAGLVFVVLAGGAILSLKGPADVVAMKTPGSGAPKAVCLITVDTLRPDMLGGGENAAVTPAIWALMEDSVVFENARSAAPWTKPAMASILSGLSPAVHGVTHRRTRMADEVEMLAERMKALGYNTMGLGLNAHLEPLYNFRQGFDRYAFPARDDWGWSAGAQVLAWLDPDTYPALFPTTRAIADVATEWIREAADEPFFLWMHVLDPHWPYEPPEEWMQGEPHPRFGRSWGDPETVTNVQAGNTKLGPEDREFVRELYRGEIRYADAEVGRVIDTLKELGLYEESLVVFASDHGEEFWEHGTFEHGHTLYDEVLRVPLAFKLPGAEHAGAVETPVSTVSVLPTMVELLGGEYEPSELSGRSLQGLWRGDGAEERPTFSTGTYYFDEKQSVVHEGWKLIRKLELDQYELYDLTADPEELDSRYYLKEAAGRRNELKALLVDWEERSRALRERLGLTDAAVEVDDDAAARLERLGYAGE